VRPPQGPELHSMLPSLQRTGSATTEINVCRGSIPSRFGIAACTLSVYASPDTSRCKTQDSIQRPFGVSADETSPGIVSRPAPAGQLQLRDALAEYS